MFKKLQMTPEMAEQRLEAQAQLQFIAAKEHDYEVSKKDRRMTEENIDSYIKIDTTKPHIANLNQDPQLSRKVNYSLEA